MKTAHSTALAKTLVVNARPGYLQKAMATNTGVAQLWLLLVDKASAPVNTDVPVTSVYLPAGTNNGFDPGDKGIRCDTGIALCVSTTAEVVTLPATAIGWFYAEFN